MNVAALLVVGVISLASAQNPRFFSAPSPGGPAAPSPGVPAAPSPGYFSAPSPSGPPRAGDYDSQLKREGAELLREADESWHNMLTPDFCSQLRLPKTCAIVNYQAIASRYTLALMRQAVPASRIGELRGRIKLACDHIHPTNALAVTMATGVTPTGSAPGGIQYCPVYDRASTRPDETAINGGSFGRGVPPARAANPVAEYDASMMRTADSFWDQATRLGCLTATFMSGTCNSALSFAASSYADALRKGSLPARSQELRSRLTQACNRLRANPQMPGSHGCD